MQYKIENKEESFDEDRAGFANRVCKLIYNQNNNDVDKSIEVGEDIFMDFEEHVHNIYELIDEHIPLIRYYRLKRYGKDNFDYDEDEYNQELYEAKLGCGLYYS